jgi:hypothetical protein
VQWTPDENCFTLRAWHDGYTHLAGGPVHHRSFEWHATGRLEVRDRITSQQAIAAVSRLHLHPDCHVECLGPLEAVVQAPGVRFRVTFSGKGELLREVGWYCPEFGLKQQNVVLAWRFGNDEAGYVIEAL